MALTDIDRNLLQRCLAGAPGAWKDFVDRFLALFVHVISHTAHSRSVQVSAADIDDLCAEIFLVILADDSNVLKRFRGNCSLATYLAVVARRVVVREISHRRMAQELGHFNAHRSSLENANVAAAEPDRRLGNHEQVQQMLERLPRAEAEVMRQFHLEGKSYSEISSHLGIPENTVGSTLHRARAKLRNENGRN